MFCISLFNGHSEASSRVILWETAIYIFGLKYISSYYYYLIVVPIESKLIGVKEYYINLVLTL